MEVARLVLAAGAGISTSVGPCIAPRYLAMVGATSGRDRAACVRVLSAFVFGSVLGYWLVANVAAVAARALAVSAYVYGVIAAVLVASALVSLARGEKHHCAEAPSQASLGGILLLGATTALTVSPCCTPMLVALGVMAVHQPIDATLEVLCYSAGHLAPLGVAALAGGTFSRFPARFSLAMTTVAAGITLGLGLYYAVLA